MVYSRFIIYILQYIAYTLYILCVHRYLQYIGYIILSPCAAVVWRRYPLPVYVTETISARRVSQQWPPIREGVKKIKTKKINKIKQKTLQPNVMLIGYVVYFCRRRGDVFFTPHTRVRGRENRFHVVVTLYYYSSDSRFAYPVVIIHNIIIII